MLMRRRLSIVFESLSARSFGEEHQEGSARKFVTVCSFISTHLKINWIRKVSEETGYLR
jgi:hypothetical protein